MLEEAVNARLAERSELLGKVDEVADIPEGVRVVALLSRNTFCKNRNNVVRKTGRILWVVEVDPRTTNDVGDYFSVTNLLVGHVLDEEAVLGRKARGLEL